MSVHSYCLAYKSVNGITGEHVATFRTLKVAFSDFNNQILTINEAIGVCTTVLHSEQDHLRAMVST